MLCGVHAKVLHIPFRTVTTERDHYLLTNSYLFEYSFIMDREIPKEVQRRATRKRWIKIVAVVVGFGVVIAVVVSLLNDSIKESDLTIRTAELGTLESSVSASGKIVPLYELAVVSPVSTKILEVYCNEGDAVVGGEPLLKLDLQSTETELQRLSDEMEMKRNDIEMAKLNDATKITDLEMRIKAKEMAVSHQKAEVANERRLDSIGSGTGERIREAELAYSTGLLELEQMKMQLLNERRVNSAALRSRQLEGEISHRNLSNMERTLEDARIKAPRRGTVTFLNKSLGTSIGQGEKLAVISDLDHFKIEGEIPEMNSGKLALGSGVNVRINRNTVKGSIGHISPQSQNGMVQFTVILQEDSAALLRSGLRTEINVVYDVQENVVRIPNGSYFQGPGTYEMFVKTEPGRLEKRVVVLGDSNFDFVEVKSGIAPGEEVVISDMSSYKKSKVIHTK